MTYVGLLRGINVGGNNRVSMKELADLFKSLGFTDVKTYINSGNVIFSATNPSITDVESSLQKLFGFPIPLIILTETELKEVIKHAPDKWSDGKTYRRYVAFLKKPLKAENAITEIRVKEGIDEVKAGPGVLYLTTRMDGLTKSSFSKLTQTSIYKQLSIRNFTTVEKIISLLTTN